MQFTLNEAINFLSRTPGVLTGLLQGLPDSWLRANEGEHTFSPFEVLGHLIHGEETDWIPRARIILTAGETRPFDPFDRFAHATVYKDFSIDELLNKFTASRKESLDTLQSWNVTEAQLMMKGLHPALGGVTLKELLSTWVVHDMGHISQIMRVLAKQYTTEVGAWKEYLSILKDR